LTQPTALPEPFSRAGFAVSLAFPARGEVFGGTLHPPPIPDIARFVHNHIAFLSRRG
jgi:hypothetical protein